MAFTPEDVKRNRDFFAEKLRTEMGRSTVLHAAEGQAPYDFVLLDTRGAKPFAEGHIPGAWNVGPENLEQALPSLPKDRPLVTYCWGHDWQLSANMALQLAERGFFVKEMNVGWKEWTHNRHPVHQGKADGLKCSCSK